MQITTAWIVPPELVYASVLLSIVPKTYLSYLCIFIFWKCVGDNSQTRHQTLQRPESISDGDETTTVLHRNNPTCFATLHAPDMGPQWAPAPNKWLQRSNGCRFITIKSFTLCPLLQWHEYFKPPADQWQIRWRKCSTRGYICAFCSSNL